MYCFTFVSGMVPGAITSNIMQTTTTQELQSTTTVKPSPAIEAGKFNGHLASFALGAFNYLLAFKVSREVAHKIAMDYASDIGRGMSENLEIVSAVGKAKKNGESVVSFSGKTHAVTQTFSMSLIRVCILIEKCHAEKFFDKRPELDTLPLTDNLADYLAEAKAWASRQTWK
jgi:hypothetical protein